MRMNEIKMLYHVTKRDDIREGVFSECKTGRQECPCLNINRHKPERSPMQIKRALEKRFGGDETLLLSQVHGHQDQSSIPTMVLCPMRLKKSKYEPLVLRSYMYPEEKVDDFSDHPPSPPPMGVASATTSDVTICKALTATMLVAEFVNEFKIKIHEKETTIAQGSGRGSGDDGNNVMSSCSAAIAIDEARKLYPTRPIGVILSLGFTPLDETMTQRAIKKVQDIHPTLHYHHIAPPYHEVMQNFDLNVKVKKSSLSTATEIDLYKISIMEEKCRLFLRNNTVVKNDLALTMDKLYRTKRIQRERRSGRFSIDIDARLLSKECGESIIYTQYHSKTVEQERKFSARNIVRGQIVDRFQESRSCELFLSSLEKLDSAMSFAVRFDQKALNKRGQGDMNDDGDDNDGDGKQIVCWKGNNSVTTTSMSQRLSQISWVCKSQIKPPWEVTSILKDQSRRTRPHTPPSTNVLVNGRSFKMYEYEKENVDISSQASTPPRSNIMSRKISGRSRTRSLPSTNVMRGGTSRISRMNLAPSRIIGQQRTPPNTNVMASGRSSSDAIGRVRTKTTSSILRVSTSSSGYQHGAENMNMGGTIANPRPRTPPSTNVMGNNTRRRSSSSLYRSKNESTSSERVKTLSFGSWVSSNSASFFTKKRQKKVTFHVSVDSGPAGADQITYEPYEYNDKNGNNYKSKYDDDDDDKVDEETYEQDEPTPPLRQIDVSSPLQPNDINNVNQEFKHSERSEDGNESFLSYEFSNHSLRSLGSLESYDC